MPSHGAAGALRSSKIKHLLGHHMIRLPVVSNCNGIAAYLRPTLAYCSVPSTSATKQRRSPACGSAGAKRSFRDYYVPARLCGTDETTSDSRHRIAGFNLGESAFHWMGELHCAVPWIATRIATALIPWLFVAVRGYPDSWSEPPKQYADEHPRSSRMTLGVKWSQVQILSARPNKPALTYIGAVVCQGDGTT